MTGTEANDVIEGTIQGDLIYGLSGNDEIRGLPGADYLDGGDGNDTLYGEAGDDVLVGGDGNDELYSGEGDDELIGGEGNDTLSDGGSTSQGNDTLYGGDGDDHLSAGSGNDTLIGGDGDDYLFSHSRSGAFGQFLDTLDGGEGNDTFYIDQSYDRILATGGSGDDTFSTEVNYAGGEYYGGAGNDRFKITYATGTLLIDGGDGDDTVDLSTANSYNGSSFTILGGSGDDTFTSVSKYVYGGLDLVAGSGADSIEIYAKTEGATLTLGDEGAADTDADSITLMGWSGTEATGITITDFDASRDTLDFDAILNNNLTGWDGSSNPFGAGLMQLIQSGSDVLLQVDVNGGGDSYITMVTFQNTDLDDFSEDTFFPAWPIDGSAPTGVTFSGTDEADILKGDIGDDTIYGLGGSDNISGSAGSDYLDGGGWQ
ncbi:calcium-binding protein [uncultured Cohaesibacter sp.]|uniref:calcium-binding protein n=1 Tax=uncultured Cohaesibacter sp. TaxID=1002546 RepID=UPI00374A766D